MTYDGRKVSEKRGLVLGTHHFQALENGLTVQYEVKIGVGWKGHNVTVKRNGILIFSPKSGFRPPTTQIEPQKTQPSQEILV
ncbi:MAG: hypothetical protein ACXADL_15090, partial [Candidatus Thorarchaeota archaeon]